MDNDNNKMQSVPYVVYESAIATSERAYKRVWSVLIISIIINLLISGLFVWERLQYDYVGDEVHYEQNGDGNNVIFKALKKTVGNSCRLLILWAYFAFYKALCNGLPLIM